MEAVPYSFVVDGELSPRYSHAFDGMRIECSEGKTVIVGTIKDQAHFQGLLDRIAALGLTLVSVAPEP